MPKAVLIIDMPENCGKCPLNYDALECIVGDAEDKLIKANYTNRPERCQLRPLVEAIPIEWLLKWTDTTESGKVWNDVGYQVIKAVINDWEKENA